jgi:serine/threonine protein kinase
MDLHAGSRLAHYEILALLGVGGMGEVYRAMDTKLKREVAIKILPPQFAEQPDRLARFEQEAVLLASLNHPHVAAIYGVEHVENAPCLVLELVEGPTLADRLLSGPIPVPEAMRIAGQIADALEAAHEKGIVHRDLKPANVKLTADGKVKVLDFGLAKAFGPAQSGGSVLTEARGHHTEAGLVMGTASYMSPEQAEGRPIDKRTDVWSFGVLLYEMLTGKRLFDGKSDAHVLVHVMEQEPDWSKLPPLPNGVQALMERCLQKDPAQRLRDIGDVRIRPSNTGRATLAMASGRCGGGYRRIRCRGDRLATSGPYRAGRRGALRHRPGRRSVAAVDCHLSRWSAAGVPRGRARQRREPPLGAVARNPRSTAA